VEARADAKINDKDNCGAERRSVAVELEINHFAFSHIDHLNNDFLMELK